jgi:hypothetical protein
MKTLLIVIGIYLIITIFFKSLLYVYDKICYNLIDYLIQKGGEKTQKIFQKF